MGDIALKKVFDSIDNRTTEEMEEIEKMRVKKEAMNRLAQVINDSRDFLLRRQDEYATEVIVTYIRECNFIYTTRDDIKSEIWFYQDGIYVPNGKTLIKEISRRILLHGYTPQRANKIIAKIEAETYIDQDEFFKNDCIEEIPIQNGILNIFTRDVSEFTPERIFFSKLPIKYNTEATCKNIEKFFGDVLKDESDSSVMFELIGFCLMKDYRFEKSFMFLGDGRNGKGKTLSLIKRFLGADNCSSVPLSGLTHNSTSVCELHGRLANIAGDLSNTDLRDTGMFKQVTGRDLIGAKRKFLRDLFFENYAKMIFACNQLPRVYDFSEGFWSRWVLFEFPYKFVKESELKQLEDKTNCKPMDENIIDKISSDDELSGLLNLALDGIERIVSNRGFNYSKGTADVKDFWIRKSDSFTAFCLDNIEEDYEGVIVKKVLRNTFMKYCKKHKVKGASDKAMKVVLEDLFGAIEGRKVVNTNQEFVWEGIKLKNS